jgi:mono/diheme cytochrome c family protein
MPAWGIDGGGPMNEQQIDNLVRYLHRIQLSEEDAKKAMEADLMDERAKVLGLDDDLEALSKVVADAEATEAEKADAQAQIDELTAQIEGDDSRDGEALFNLNCARCHTQGWSYNEPKDPGGGAFGPPLYNSVNQFPDIEDQIDWVTNGRKRGERYGETGQASGRMPYFLHLLTADQIKAIVEYERGLEVQN